MLFNTVSCLREPSTVTFLTVSRLEDVRLALFVTSWKLASRLGHSAMSACLHEEIVTISLLKQTTEFSSVLSTAACASVESDHIRH
jgi:hypothetical protein